MEMYVYNTPNDVIVLEFFYDGKQISIQMTEELVKELITKLDIVLERKVMES